MSTRLRSINPHLLIALALALVFHGSLELSGTFKGTYDAFVHIFFADHYARYWFDHWDYRWYTGFPMTGYPPGSQQSVALLSLLIPGLGLLTSFVIVQIFAVLMVVLGIYRFSKIWVSEEAAGYAALLIVFSSSIGETIHVFGQLPTTFSLGFLLNALPYVYEWLKEGRWRVLWIAWSVNAATTAGHHVTTLFGAVFFVAPVMVLAIVEKFREPWEDEAGTRASKVTKKNFRPMLIRRLRRIVPVVARTGIYGVGMIVMLILVVLPYWLWSASDPITQVSIPHASRDSFIVNQAAGLVFFVVPWGIPFFLLPYAFYKGLTTRAWPMTLSLGLLFFLGTGGTTPGPRFLLRAAFDILTLDRFTFWGTITVVPLIGEFVVSLRHGRFAHYLQTQFGYITWRGVQTVLIVGYLFFDVLVVNLTQFRRFQPAPIDTQPIVNFMNKDQHDRWRYLTLGFGDQVAWLGAQMTATSVDGNYHSARRLPELTSTPVERLEGAKFRGMPGIGSLQQFLAVPDKYNLKYVFSNDQFYDPLLYFSGWHRIRRLGNGIMIWERADISPLPEVLPRKEIPLWQRTMWGIVPMGAIFFSAFTMTAYLWGPYLLNDRQLQRIAGFWGLRHGLAWASRFWRSIDNKLYAWSQIPPNDHSPQVRWQRWLNVAVDIGNMRPATPSAKVVRTGFVLLLAGGIIGNIYSKVTTQAHSPEAQIEAYYDDLDFRRFEEAYARLDPRTRPGFDQYLLELSVGGGLVASYAKLDSIWVDIIKSEPNRLEVEATTEFITSLNTYTTKQQHVLHYVDGNWMLQPAVVGVTVPPEQFVRRRDVAWLSQGRQRVTTETTSFNDVLDRPELQILSARLVKVNERYSLVGELINVDNDPADITVTAYLYDKDGETLSWYNAQQALVHKLFPKEVTPFRVDFEGVAGAVLSDTVTAGEFEPEAYSPVIITRTIENFAVYGKAVITTRDLDRDVAAQNVEVVWREGKPRLIGELLNAGTVEATIPHIFITYYDENNHVVWVDDHYLEVAVRPQRSQPFSIPITLAADVETILNRGEAYANTLQSDVQIEQTWRERIPLPPELGYTSLRIMVHYFVGPQ